MKKIMKHNILAKAFGLLICIELIISCNEQDVSPANGGYSLSYLLNATGQTTLYDLDGATVASITEGASLYGQDANYLKGAPMTFRDNGDSTVSDLNTGLMWQQIPVPDEFTWQEAANYCENLSLAGYDDWRIPSLKELFSISDFSAGWPYLDTAYFALAGNVISKDEQYWSSNKYVGVTAEGGNDAAFGVNHVTGHIKAYPAGTNMMPQDSTAGNGSPNGTGPGAPPPGGNGQPGFNNPMTKYVRAVRGTEYGENDFVDNDDGTISDQATGLMWAKADNGNGLNWGDALQYAENSTLAGYTDWRLPNVKELQSIVDYSRAPGATDAANEGPAIDPMFECTAIVNEAGDDDYGYSWTSTSAHFTSGEPFYYAWYVAFGRAVNDQGVDFHGAGAVRFDTKYEGGPLGEGGERFYNYVRLVRDAYGE